MFNFLRKKPSESLFEELVDSYQEPVYNFIRRRVGSHDDAADISQEVFIRVYRNLGSLKDLSAAGGWIFRIAANETNRFLTDRYRATHISTDDEIIVEPTAPMADGLTTEQINARFRQALDRLSPRQRNVFDLRYFQELSYEDIAVAMQSNVNTMKATYHIAKQKISEFILEN